MKTKILFILIALFFVKSFSQEKKDSILENNSSKTNSTRNLKKINSDSFLMTNAINFDFGGTSKNSTGYFGHINYFFNLKNFNGERTHKYINTGLMKVNYYSPELNTGSIQQIDRVKISPLDTSTQYIEMFNQYNYEVKFNSYSAYVQFLMAYFNSRNIYLHLHSEFLVSNISTEINIKNIEKKTLEQQNITPLISYLPEKLNYDKQNLAGYFGGGLTAKYNFYDDEKTNIDYFLQLTSGISKMQVNPKLISIDSNLLPKYEKSKSVEPFFIVHSYLENDISNVNIIIGSQVRGNFKNPPLYTFYIGLNSSLENFKNIFK